MFEKVPCSERLKQASLIRNIKQVELCEKTGIKKSAMSQYFRGTFEPKQNSIYLLAKVLDVTEAWLMGYDVPMERTESGRTALNESSSDSREQAIIKRPTANSDEPTTEKQMQIIDTLKKLSPENFRIAVAQLDTLLRLQENKDNQDK